MNVRTLAYRFLSIVTLLALLQGTVPVTAGLAPPAPSAVEGSSAEGPVHLVDAPVQWDGDRRTSGDGVADDQARVSGALHSAPLMFIENVGQFDPRARFQVRGADRTLWLAEDALWVTLLEPDTPVEQVDVLNLSIQNPKTEIENRQAVHLKLSFAGANPRPRLEPFDRLDTHVSYFVGSDPGHWRPDVPVWGGVRYVDLYPGLDLEITGGDTWSWRIVARAPEADLGAVRLRVDGADGLALDDTLDSAGRRSVRVSTALGEFALPLLECLRGFGGSLQAGSDFTHRELLPYEGHSQPSQALVPRVMGSEVVAPFAGKMPQSGGAHAPTHVLDRPADLLYATFLGGSESEHGRSIAVDESGNAYVAGSTASSDFPAASGPGYQTVNNGSVDAFVVKLDPSGTGLDYATFLGGRSNEYQEGLAVDALGNAYLTGNTGSTDFPVTPGAYDTSLGGINDEFVVKLSASGTNLAYATFLGGSYYEHGGGIVVDRSGNAYVTGSTYSFNFPAASGPGYDTSHNGDYDAFVVKLNPGGTGLDYATFLGGSDADGGDGIAVDGSGNAYVTGGTGSSDFPAAGGPGYDTSHNGVSDVFVVKLNASGTVLDYATFLGGSDSDGGDSIAVDGSGNTYVTGGTGSSDFPAAGGPGYDTSYSGVSDAFVVKLNASGTALDYATFLGGSDSDGGDNIAVDGSGNAYVTGQTKSSDFPAVGGPGYDTSHNGDYDGFVVNLNPAGTSLAYATFLGASGRDYCLGIAVDGSGNAYVTGKTESSDFPAVGGPGYDTSYNGGGDAFVVKLVLAGLVHPTALDFGAMLTELTLSINSENLTDAWTLSESIPWLDLSDTSGTGAATITASVDRAGQPEGPHSGTINATVGGQAVTVNVTMRVVMPDVTIVTPLPGSTFYHSAWMLVKAAVTLEGQPLVGAQVKGRIILDYVDTLPVAVPIAMYDDGDHFDGNADDGIYAGDVVLYGSATMPVSDNPYLLTVIATADSGSGSDSISINLAASDGAPTVAVEVSGPSAPDYFVDQQATVTATLTYPDSSVHTDTAVTLTVIAPDLTVTHVGLANVAGDTWRGTYTFDQSGTTYLDVRVDPPAGLGFVDGWGGSQVYVYLDDLEMAVNPPPGTALLYGTVPLSVCVTADSARIDGAIVNAKITWPVAEDAGALSEVGTSGCYAGSYTPDHSGTHSITYYAEKPGYLSIAQNGSFQVSTQQSSLEDRLQKFGDSAVVDSKASMTLLEGAAEDGDYFARKLEKDRVKLVVDALVGIGFTAISGVEAAHTVATEGWKVIEIHKLPGFRFVAEETALSAHEAIGHMMGDAARETLTKGTGRIVSEVAMNMPLRYYATRGNPNKDVRRPLKDYIQDEYQAIVPGSNSLEGIFVQALDPAAQSNQSDLRLNTAQAIDDVPDMSLEEETEYIQELALRQETNHWLSWGELMYRGDQLSLAQDRREAEEHDWFGKLISFFISMGLKVGAGAICDGPCVFLVSGVQTGVQAYLNEQAIEEDQRMRDLALNLMHMGYEVQAVLWSNTNAGLALVASKGTLETPSGSLDEIRLKRTTAPLGFERDVYAEITISNPLADSVTALYGVKAYYLTADGYLQVSQNTIDPDGEETRLLVELAPGESKTVRLYLCRHNEFDDGRPRRGDPIRFNLYAYTDKGSYLVDAEPHVDYEPEKAADLAAADRVSVHLLSSPAVSADMPLKLVATSGVSDTARFPLMARIGFWPDSVTYTLAIYAENPWPGPIATVISQSIPSEVTVLDAGDGVVRDGAVVWHRIIQPRETVVSHVEFDYADYGVEATLPAATMQFYDPADDAMITLSSDPLTFQARIPLRASADADLQVAPDSQQTVAATVTNLDSSSARQGDLVLHVWTITGTEVLSTTAHVSLGAGGSQDYDLAYTAPDEGLYVLEVSLRYGDETTPVICDLLKVRENRVYLPVVLRN